MHERCDVYIHHTEKFDRRALRPWTMLWPEDMGAIWKELNDYRRFEMNVHPDNEHLTKWVWVWVWVHACVRVHWYVLYCMCLLHLSSCASMLCLSACTHTHVQHAVLCTWTISLFLLCLTLFTPQVPQALKHECVCMS